MFILKNERILLTKGDAAELTVDLVRELADGTKETYTMAEGDTLRFTAKKNNLCKTDALELTSVGAAAILFRPEDTKELPTGEYVYDIELTRENSDPYTVIGQGIPGMDAVLVLLPEVTR